MRRNKDKDLDWLHMLLRQILLDSGPHAWDSRLLRLMARFVYPFQEIGEGLPQHERPFVGRHAVFKRVRKVLKHSGHHFTELAQQAVNSMQLLKSASGWEHLLLSMTERFMSLAPMQVKTFEHEGEPAYVHVPCRAIDGQLGSPMLDVWRADLAAGQRLGHCASCGQLRDWRTSVFQPVSEAFFRQRPVADIRSGEPSEQIREQLLPAWEFYG